MCDVYCVIHDVPDLILFFLFFKFDWCETQNALYFARPLKELMVNAKHGLSPQFQEKYLLELYITFWLLIIFGLIWIFCKFLSGMLSVMLHLLSSVNHMTCTFKYLIVYFLTSISRPDSQSYCQKGYLRLLSIRYTVYSIRYLVYCVRYGIRYTVYGIW